MRRAKEIHLVNISFIDMLAGALGAVMILFIIVPKVSFSDLEKIKTLDSLAINKANMDSMLVSLKSVVPEKEYQDLIQSSATLQASIEALKVDVDNVQSALKRKTDQYNNVAKKYDQAMTNINSLNAQLKNAPSATQYNKMATELKAAKAAKVEKLPSKPAPSNKPIASAPVVSSKKEPDAAAVRDETPGIGDAIFGIDPPLTIMINWEDKSDKVHLYMRQSGTSNWVFYQTKRRRASFGTWDNSLRKLTSKPFEAIVQKDQLVPGTYEIYAQPQTAKAGSVDVTGFIAMKLPDKPIKKYNLSAKKINISKPPYTGSSTETLLGSLTVTADDITWNPN